MTGIQFWAIIFSLVGVIATALFNLIGIKKQAAATISVAKISQRTLDDKADHSEITELKTMIEALEKKLEDCNKQVRTEVSEKIELMIKLVKKYNGDTK